MTSSDASDLLGFQRGLQIGECCKGMLFFSSVQATAAAYVGSGLKDRSIQSNSLPTDTSIAYPKNDLSPKTLNRFCEAMIDLHGKILQIISIAAFLTPRLVFSYSALSPVIKNCCANFG